jgi:hypothetical protein
MLSQKFSRVNVFELRASGKRPPPLSSRETLQPSNLSKYHPLTPAWQSDCFETDALFLRKNHARFGFQTTLKDSCLGVSGGNKRLLRQHSPFQEFSGANVEPKVYPPLEGMVFSYNEKFWRKVQSEPRRGSDGTRGLLGMEECL